MAAAISTGAAGAGAGAGVSANSAEQSDELEAVRAIYPELQPHPKLPTRYQLRIALGGAAGTLDFEFWYNSQYPQSAAPDFYLEAPGLTRGGLELLRGALQGMFVRGQVVVFVWLNFLHESGPDGALALLTANHTPLNPLFEKPKSTVNAAIAAAAVAAANADPTPAAVAGSSASGSPAKQPAKAAAAVAASASDDKCPEIFSSAEPVKDRKSVFIAHCARVHTVAECAAVLARLKSDRKVAVATHNIVAYRLRSGGSGSTGVLEFRDDDGEDSAGPLLLGVLKRMRLLNVFVCCSRWYGGILLGPDRFRHITGVSKALLDVKIDLFDSEDQPPAAAAGAKGGKTAGKSSKSSSALKAKK